MEETNSEREKAKKSPVDVEKLIKDNPNDPQIGQGYNDARGDFVDTNTNTDYKNLKNHLGPEQKRRREPHIGVVQTPENPK